MFRPFAIVALCCVAVNLYAMPARRYDVGRHHLNLLCLGSGRPVVVLDAGLGDWSPAWSPVQRRLSSLTTVCAYDRAGYGFSGAARSPRTSMEIVADLHALLLAAHLPRPYVLVGHSFGGLNQQAFAEKYLRDVAGLVLVDSTAGDLPFPAFLKPFTDAELASGQKCASLARDNKLRSDSPAFEDCFQWLFGLSGLPNSGITPTLLSAVKEQARHAAPYEAHVSELRNVTKSQQEVSQNMRSFGALPMVVLTASAHGENHLPGAMRAAMLRFEPKWRMAQDRLASHSSCAQHDLIHSDHYIQFYRPQIVIDAITRVVLAARAGGCPTNKNLLHAELYMRADV